MIKAIFKELENNYKTIDHSWWPVSNSFEPKVLEIIVGAVLTQNTSWRNTEKALQNMTNAKLTTTRAIVSAQTSKIEKSVRPSGFYKQKAERIKALMIFLNKKRFKNITRDELLALKGIGPETADSILLYGFNEKHFVIDSYTRRIFSRLGIIKGEEKYDELKALFEKSIKSDANAYKKFHALIVEHAKQVCRKKPECDKCFLNKKCMYSKV
jgi:endonuclease-3 related protein